MICAPLNQCSYKIFVETLHPVSSAAPRESMQTRPRLRFEGKKRSKHSVPALAVAGRSRRPACPSQRSWLIVLRCSRAPCRPSVELLTFSMTHIHLLVEGVMLCCIRAHSLRWTVHGSPARKTRNLQTLEIDAKDPPLVAHKGQSRLQISLEKRDDHSTADDSGPQQPLSDAPAELPILHHRGQPCYSVARIRA